MRKRQRRNEGSATTSVVTTTVESSTATKSNRQQSRPLKPDKTGRTTTEGGPISPTAASAVAVVDERVRAAEAEMKACMLGGCYGCLGAKHKYGEGICRATCPFCGLCFRRGTGMHFAILCQNKPSTRKEILAALCRPTVSRKCR